MRLLSWNVQWCQGLDGTVDPSRIAGEARRIAEPDVACFQEVSIGFHGDNQVDLLRREVGVGRIEPNHGGGNGSSRRARVRIAISRSARGV